MNKGREKRKEERKEGRRKSEFNLLLVSALSLTRGLPWSYILVC